MKLLFELSTSEMSPDDWATDYDLEHFFFKQNPWWVEEGLPVSIEEEGSSREEVINELKDVLPCGYNIEFEKVIISDRLKYWQDNIERVKELVATPVEINAAGFNPLSWWKNQIDALDTSILIYLKQFEELMTLNEFLLFMMREKTGTLYIGSIFNLYD